MRALPLKTLPPEDGAIRRLAEDSQVASPARIEEETVDQSHPVKWRALRWLVAMMVVTLSIAACGPASTATTKPSTAASQPAASQPAASQPAASSAGGTLNVLSLWGGSEETAFKNVLAAFTTKTGIAVNYEADRATYATTLQSRITGGNPPDIGIIPGIGFLRRFAKDGSLTKISDLGVDASALAANYPAGFIAAGTVDGTLYAVPAKYNSKGTMWYRPDLYTTAGATVPTDWTSFKAALDKTKTAPGSLGLGAKDDWTLTDWFESIYIRQAGVEAYDKLFSATGNWSDPTVGAAVDKMKEVLNDNYVAGGVTAALGRSFTDGIGQVFSTSPQAATYYEGGFVGGIAIGQTNTALVPGTTIDWYPFPKIGTADLATFGGDVIGAFTNTPQAAAFVKYLITPEANNVWASTGAIVSPNKGVALTAYPNDLVKREATQLNTATIRYDGSDLLPAGIAGAGLGPLLQNAIQGQTVDWADFQTRVAAAWAAE